MSATATLNRTRHNTINVLADYELHHSRAADDEGDEEATPKHTQGNPDSWPTDRRRIPPYRPVQPDRDLSQRRVYRNHVEGIFVTLIFLGAWANGSTARLWRMTGGRMWNVQYKIGGEF